MDMFASSAAFAAAPLAVPASLRRRRRLSSPRRRLSSPISNAAGAVDTPALRAAMSNAFGGSDAEGAWDWKTAYDACEAATVLFLRRFGPGMRARAGSPAALLAMLAKVAALLPSHTRRSEESQALQQFSTPIALGFAAATAAAITPGRSRAGALGRHRPSRHLRRARRRPARLERAGRDPRRPCSAGSFPALPVTRHDAAHIHDHLDLAVAAERRADEPAVLGRGACRGPRRRRGTSAMSPRRWRASPMAGGSSRSPAQAWPRTIRPGGMASSTCSNAAASCSPPPSTAASMPATARPSTRV